MWPVRWPGAELVFSLKVNQEVSATSYFLTLQRHWHDTPLITHSSSSSVSLMPFQLSHLTYRMRQWSSLLAILLWGRLRSRNCLFPSIMSSNGFSFPPPPPPPSALQPTVSNFPGASASYSQNYRGRGSGSHHRGRGRGNNQRGGGRGAHLGGPVHGAPHMGYGAHAHPSNNPTHRYNLQGPPVFLTVFFSILHFFSFAHHPVGIHGSI